MKTSAIGLLRMPVSVTELSAKFEYITTNWLTFVVNYLLAATTQRYLASPLSLNLEQEMIALTDTALPWALQAETATERSDPASPPSLLLPAPAPKPSSTLHPGVSSVVPHALGWGTNPGESYPCKQPQLTGWAHE